MAKGKIQLYKFVITLKDGPTGPRVPRTAVAMSYRDHEEFIIFDDVRGAVYQVRRELVDEIACDGRPVAEQDVDELGSTIPIGA